MYEQGPIRPPSEASSLLVRVTRNCPWNQCLFCPAYKGAVFSKRSTAEIKQDIDEMARKYGPHAAGIRSAFLQDADSLIMSTSKLIDIIGYLKARFPGINRLTTYARARTMTKKGLSEYRELKDAGLTRIHTGMESGSSEVLKRVRKGSTPEDMVTGGQRVKASGISLSEYIMPGLGGRSLSRVHAVETANLLNAIEPDHIRVRTFALPPSSPMQEMAAEGSFVPMTDEEIVAEIRLLLANLKEIPAHFHCADFSLNLLMQVDGRLDREKTAMLEELDRFLGLTKEQQQAYVLLQRSSPYFQRPVGWVKDEKAVKKAWKRIQKLERGGKDGFDRYIRRLMAFQLPRPQKDNW
jgi:radical SAM superfamily enzyme